MVRTSLLSILAFLATNSDDAADFAKLAKHADPDKRCQAIQLVAKQRDLPMARLLFPLLGDPHPRVRHRAVNAVSGAARPDVADFLVDPGLKHPDAAIRRSILQVLGRIKTAVPAEPVRRRLADKDPGVRAQACRTAGLLGDREAVSTLETIGGKDADPYARAAAIEAILKIDPKAAGESLRRAIQDRSPIVRLIALQQISLIDAEAAVPAVGTLIHDPDWRVRSAAIDAALSLRRASFVGDLIGRLGRESGRLKWELMNALLDLAGRDLGPDAAPWKAWWEANRERFAPGAAGGAGMTRVEGESSFFSLPIVSKRILFVLDMSGSMREPAPGDPGRTKLDVAKEGMIAAIQSLAPDVQFGILGLASDESGAYVRKEQLTFKRALRLWPATPAVRTEVEKFINGLQSGGWTNLWDGIEYAYACDEVDTLYVYTDGGVSRGIWTSGPEILEQLAAMNRCRRIAIHAVEVAGTTPNPPDNVRLLKDIAKMTKGMFKPAGEK